MKQNNGYIALISVVIISLILVTIAFSLSQTGLMSRLLVLTSDAKERGVAAAEACADMARLKLTQNSSYAGNETIAVGSDDTCQILAIETTGSSKIIKTKAIVLQTVTNSKVTVNSSDLSILSWDEVANF